jgi:hypothetical protein
VILDHAALGVRSAAAPQVNQCVLVALYIIDSWLLRVCFALRSDPYGSIGAGPSIRSRRRPGTGGWATPMWRIQMVKVLWKLRGRGADAKEQRRGPGKWWWIKVISSALLLAWRTIIFLLTWHH